MKLSSRETDFLKEVLDYTGELARIDNSDPVKLLDEEGFPEEGLETVKKRSGLTVEQDILPSLVERGLIEKEARTEKRTITEEESYGFREEEVTYLRFSEEILDWFREEV